MILQTEIIDIGFDLNAILSVFFIIALIGLMLLCYLKIRIPLVILFIFLFSLIIGIMFLSVENVPFTPYIQLFFIFFQSIFLIITFLEAYNDK